MKYPYYKIQLFNDISLAWKDIQRSYNAPPNERIARYELDGKRARIMQVNERDRHPLV